jgi:hypothetical protein
MMINKYRQSTSHSNSILPADQTRRLTHGR